MTITDIIDNLDRLITAQKPLSEIKPKLVFLRDQAEAMESRVGTLEAEAQARDQAPLVRDLEALVGTLRINLEDAKREIQELRSAADTKQKDTDRRPKSDEDILLLLTNRHEKTAREIASALGISQDLADDRLAGLNGAKLVRVQIVSSISYGPRTQSPWSLSDGGRQYLVRYGLV